MLGPRIEADPMTCDGMDGELYDVMAPNVRTLGLAKGQRISFSWLAYIHGQTAKRMLMAGDVLTGFMSGCCVATWTEDGSRYVGHVGTVGANEAVNRAVKQTFAASMSRDTTGFFSAAAWPPGEIVVRQRNFKGGATPKVLALITTSGQFYAILMFALGKMPNMQQTGDWCVGGIKQVRAQDYLTLRRSLGMVTMGARGR